MTEIRDRLETIVATGVPGAVVVVVGPNGRVEDAAGLADLATGEPLTPGHRFRIGSVTKIFVATLVLQLVEVGLLELDGEATPFVEGITVRQLLSHTSGLDDFIGDPIAFFEPYRRDPGHRWELGAREELELALAKPRLFPPGEGWAYHGANYIVLRLLVEDATGLPLDEALRQRVFAPLGLDRTDLVEGPLVGDCARGYLPADNPILPADSGAVDVTEIDVPFHRAGGGIVSTAGEVATLLRTLLGGHLLPDRLRAEMLDAVASDWPETDRYGLGIGEITTLMRRERSPCGAAWGHLGFSLGYVAIALSSSDGERQVVICANGQPATDAAEEASSTLPRASPGSSIASDERPYGLRSPQRVNLLQELEAGFCRKNSICLTHPHDRRLHAVLATCREKRMESFRVNGGLQEMGRTRRVLVIDDDELLCELIRTTFELEGFEVTTAHDVIEAERALTKSRPDAILLDIGLPGIDGVFYLERLRETPHTSRIPIVAISGSEEAGRAATAAGAEAFLRKPFSPLELLGLVTPMVKRLVPDADEGSGVVDAADLNRLIEIGRRQHELLTEAYAQTVAVLASALESRDFGTSEHSRRVTSYATRLTLEVAPSLLDDPSLEWGFLLHDVGKIGVPDEILLKPGTLTARERRRMQKHAELGERLLAHIPLLNQEGARVIRSHHERWDGDGYPDRLSAESIPLGARIFAVVDSLDAMTDQRPYRQPISWDEAVEEIRRCAGGQFDPDIVYGFEACEPELYRLHTKELAAA